MTEPLTEKYRPKYFYEIKGQEIAVDKLKNFFHLFIKGASKKNAIILHGPAGTGKTVLAHVLAKETGCEIFELNASDLRNRQKLEEVMKPSIEQKSLFARGKVVLIDEVDGVTTTDYGGLAELITLIEKTKAPIIITANDIWQHKFSLLRAKCELVQLKEIPYITILELLREVLKREAKEIDENLLKGIAAKARGDLRAALNDLQSIIDLERGKVTEEDIGEREKDLSIFYALKNIFKLKPTAKTIEAYDSVNMETDEVILWLEKNIPKEYEGKELAEAFEALSKADIFKGRIHRQQHWRFLNYQNFFLTAGIAAAKKMKNPDEFVKYEKPTRILKIWMTNQRNAKKKSIAQKYAEYVHISRKRALRDFFLVALTIDEDIMQKLNLSDQEKEFLIEYKGALKVFHGLNKFAEKKYIYPH